MEKLIARSFNFDCLADTNFSTNEFNTVENRSPSFQDSFSLKSKKKREYEFEIQFLRQKLKEMESSHMKSYDDLINDNIKKMNEFQDKERKFRNNYEDLEKKYQSLVWTLDTMQKENIFLKKQLQADNPVVFLQGFSQTSNENSREIVELTEKCKKLETDLSSALEKKKTKSEFYKNKILSLETMFNQFFLEKNQKSQETEEKSIKKQAEPSSPPDQSKSPINSLKSSRRGSKTQLQNIVSSIQSLEKSQARIKKKYFDLQVSGSVSFREKNKLYDMLINNEKRLQEAKKLKKNIKPS